MGKKAFWILPVIFVIIALVVAYFFDTGSDVPFSSYSTGERGASLFYDTLRHMGYPVRQSRRPLTRDTDTGNIYIIIQPAAPVVNMEIAEEMLEWVRDGGRLVYLCRFHPQTAIARAAGVPGQSVGEFIVYRVGQGEIITGRASWVVNRFMMEEYTYGQAIQTMISRWRAEREPENIFFAEYYHGFHSPETFIAGLPLVMRLVLAQFIIFAIIAVWHLGKRFGNPVPAYEETEREENEYVRALARLYMESERKKEE